MKLSKPSDITNITFLNWLVGSYKKVSDHKNHAWSFCLAPNCSVSSNCWGHVLCKLLVSIPNFDPQMGEPVVSFKYWEDQVISGIIRD